MSIRKPASDLHALIRTRRSVRRFTEQAVPTELIERIIETAAYAPNAHNRQPWRFIVLTSEESKSTLAESMGADFRQTLLAEGLSLKHANAQVHRSRERITQAPVAMLVGLDTTTLDQYDDPIRQQGELTMAVQSVAMAGSYLLLAAHAEGLGAVWICAPLFTPDTVQEVLELPESWIAQGMLLLGYPAKIPPPKSRNPIETVTTFL